MGKAKRIKQEREAGLRRKSKSSSPWATIPAGMKLVIPSLYEVQHLGKQPVLVPIPLKERLRQRANPRINIPQKQASNPYAHMRGALSRLSKL